MSFFIQDKTSLMVGIVTLTLILLQLAFGFLMKKRKEDFKKYHQTLGVFIFIVILINILVFPVNFIISILVLLAVLAQIIIGYFVAKGNRKLLKYHRPLGVFIFILAIANLILIFPR
ncbi:MAG: hypothetical protein PHU42_01965 [Patescibacteria group bacterium]|nr:hypothetical protein [Patescibacteria group bacterium]